MAFLFKPKHEAAHADASRNQALATDPTTSAWVSANAGTGKTHVLTRRLLRLLLDGTPPERVLALTYTKAAAAEMSKRLFAQLSEWVTASDSALKARLLDLTGQPPGPEKMHLARQLFAIAIETPGGLKVQTIHAFCERLLQRFPLEAGIPPGFTILDDQERSALLKQAVNDVLIEAADAPGTPLAASLQTAVGFATDADFDALLGDVLQQREWLETAARLHSENGEELAGAEEIYRRALGLNPQAELDAVQEKLSVLLSTAELVRLREVLSSGSSNDANSADCLADALRAHSPEARIRSFAGLFLTGKGEPRKQLMTKPLAAEHPEADGLLKRAQERFLGLHAEWRKLKLLSASMALLRLGNAVMQCYGNAKRRRAALDFDDLVARTASLLASPAGVEWVLYKLDGGLDHILVDEAQDTSPVQWRILQALAEEFFSGTGARDVARTLFAVGDQKQSIYSFQGAAPTMFAGVGEDFAARAKSADRPWRRIPLNVSFRTVAPLLAAVDHIFKDPQRTPGVTASAASLQHVPHRTGQAGLVEIWPIEKPAGVAPAEPWSPLSDESAPAPVVRLATRIAATIDGWLSSGELLQSENRPVRAGDILILVRKRAPFAPAMVSALKARGIKVAGADRLMLLDQICVQDLMSLGDFLNQPEDDLALAEILKSPLFGLDDEDLLALAPDRKGALWHELLSRAHANSRLGEVAATLKRWRIRADCVPPFEFFSGLLDAEGLRARMLARLGAESAEALDEFLNLALAYDDTAPPSLQGFLSWLRAGWPEVKRDMEQGRDEVRVMTVHGAKGLEAPIVFLPDTCSTVSGRRIGSLLMLSEAERPLGAPPPFLWPVKGTSQIDPVRHAKAAMQRAETEERNRLLYVALTRARDRLYIAGFQGAKAPPGDCWYNLITEALRAELREIKTADGRTIWQIKGEQTAGHDAPQPYVAAPVGVAPLPAWVKKPAPPEPVVGIPLLPSRLAPLEMEGAEDVRGGERRRIEEPTTLGPIALTDQSRFLRGTMTHALLEHLPGLPQDRWSSAARAFLATRASQLSARTREEIIAETLRVLQHPSFAPVFGPDSRAEIPIAAEIPLPEGQGLVLRLTGKIDRLARTGSEVLVIDYKTNRPPPDDPSQIAEAYLLQLAAYRLGVARIFPALRVRAAILWTDGPRLMEIPESLLDAHQQMLWELSPASLDA